MGELTHLKQGPGERPKNVQQTLAGHGDSLLSGGGWRLQVIREVMSGGFFSYQGNQQRAVPHCPFGKNNHQLGPGVSM